jgi:hypothetical protein
MKQSMKTCVLLGIVMFAVSPAGWSQEFNYSSYTQTTLHDIVAEEQNHSFDQTEAKPDASFLEVECKVTKYRVRCSYSDLRRPISEMKGKLIELWMETLSADSNLAPLYRQEIQVMEGLNAHWIPIQEKLLPHINRELVKDDTIELFIVLMGKVEAEPVLIATEFEKITSPSGRPISTTAYARIVQ